MGYAKGVLRRWLVAKKTDPATPILEVVFRRLWWHFRGRAVVNVRAPAGAEWENHLWLTLHESPLFDPRTSRPLDPPHDRSADRVGLALDDLNRRSPVLVAYAEGEPPPSPVPAAPPVEPDPFERTRRMLVDELAAALSEAERRGESVPVEDRALLIPLMQASDEAAFRAALQEVAKAAAGRPILRENLARRGMLDRMRR